MRADFTIKSALEYFDMNQDGEVDYDDFRIGCLQLGLEVTQMLKVEDIFTPKDQTYRIILLNRKEKPLGFETKRLMKEIIKLSR